MQFEILTLFPEIFTAFLNESLISKAIQNNLIEIGLYNFRQHGLGKHTRVDDEPYGGGPGMVLRVEPVHKVLMNREEYFSRLNKKIRKILITPQGIPFNQQKAQELKAAEEVLVLICGRYEGFDERVRNFVDEEISGGDFICLGGEVIAMTIVEAISRLIPGILGNFSSKDDESFSKSMLEYPQYTRPPSYNNLNVPEILLSGHHQKIADWRKEQALKKTLEKRPDLLKVKNCD